MLVEAFFETSQSNERLSSSQGFAVDGYMAGGRHPGNR